MTDRFPSEDDSHNDAMSSQSPPRKKIDWRRIAQQREYGVLAILILTVVGVSIINPGFLAGGNIRDKLVAAAPMIIIACGVTLIIITGEIDISVGSLMGFCAAVLGTVTSDERWHWPVWLGVLITLFVGAGVGMINGLLITVGRVPSIIVTLGMLTILRGLAQWIVGPTWIQALPESLRFFGSGEIYGVRVSILVAILVVAVFFMLTRQTPLGRRIYAVGSNVRSAQMAGISERKVKLSVFVITGLLTAIATLISATQLGVIDSGFGKNSELFVVTCVVVGGTSISGGRGTVVGSILGVLLLSSIGTVLIFMKLGPYATYWERAILGAFILLAVLTDHLVKRRSGETRS